MQRNLILKEKSNFCKKKNLFSVNDEDKAFLEVLRKLEANECDVDDDSILAPFSQKDEKTEVILSQQTGKPFGTQTNGSTPTNANATDQHYLDEDDDLMNEFSKNLDDLLPLDMYVPLISRDDDTVVMENV